MNLKSLSDNELQTNIESLVKNERELLTEILHHLREVESRRLFSALGFTSLFDYAVKKLGYSADQAHRRICAMRMIREIPEVEEKLESGALNLTTASMAYSLFRKENMPGAKQVEILEKLEFKSTREAEKIVIAEAREPLKLKADSVKPLKDDLSEVRFSADKELMNKLEEIKGLLAHSCPNASMNEILHKVCDIALQKLSPKHQSLGAPKGALQQKNPRQISAHTKRLVWKKANGSCQKCGSRHALQVDHCKPVGFGGSNAPGNLRLLCRSCNQRTAIESFGLNKMNKWLNGRARAEG